MNGTKKAFEDYLREKHGALTIAGREYDPASTLARLDPDGYSKEAAYWLKREKQAYIREHDNLASKMLKAGLLHIADFYDEDGQLDTDGLGAMGGEYHLFTDELVAEFDRFLDDRYKLIGGGMLPLALTATSKALKELDPARYSARFLAWLFESLNDYVALGHGEAGEIMARLLNGGKE